MGVVSRAGLSRPEYSQTIFRLSTITNQKPMKNQLFTLALLLISAASFAQTAADEAAIKTAVVQETKAAYALQQAEHDACFSNVASAFIASNNRSGYQVFSGATSLSSVFGGKPREVNPRLENATFKFYGPNAAFVTYDQYLYDKPSKEVRMMEKQNGQWKVGSSVSLWDYSQNKFEEDAVRKVLETETRAFHEANGELLRAQWSTKPYAERQHANLEAALGVPYVKGDKLTSFADAYMKTLKPSGQTTRVSDYDVHISGAMAWATFTQERLDKAGTVLAKQREIRVLERETAGWKIVFLGLQEMK